VATQPRGTTEEPDTESIVLANDESHATLARGGPTAGTPNYMAPEQYRGEAATVQTDVYAYCVTLFEALYDARPFGDADTLAAIANAKLDGPPEIPAGSGVPRRIGRAIVRGLAVESTLRWESMHALLAELQRASAKNSRGAAIALSAVAVAALTGAAFAGGDTCSGEHQLTGVWDDARRATLHATFADAHLVFAVDSEAEVQRAVDQYAEAWVETRRNACEVTSRGEQSSRWFDLSSHCLSGRRQQLSALLDVVERGDPKALERALSAVQALPKVEACLGGDAEVPPPTDPAVTEQVEQERTRLAEVAALDRTGLHAQALPLAQSVIGSAERIGYAPLIAEAKYWLGRAHANMGEVAKGSEVLAEAAWLAHKSQHSEIQVRAAVHLTYLLGAKQADISKGLWWADYAQAELDRTAAGPYLRSRLANNRGATFNLAGRYDDAEAAFTESLRYLEKAGKADTVESATGIDNLGIVLRRRGRLDEAIEHHKRALVRLEAAYGGAHPLVAASLTNMAGAMVEHGDYEEAKRIHQRVLEIHEKAYGPRHRRVATPVHNLAAVAFKQGDYAKAERLFQRAYDIRKVAMPGHPKTASTLSSLALVVHIQGGRDDESEEMYRQTLVLQRKVSEPRDIARTLNNLGTMYSGREDLERAAAAYREVVAIYEKELPPDHPDIALTLTNLGNVLRMQGEFEEALANQRRALQIRDTHGATAPRSVAFALESLAVTYREADDPKQAIVLLERALVVAAAAQSAEELRGRVEYELAVTLLAAKGDPARARALVESARERYAELEGQESARAELDVWLASHPG
ncbi:MAG: tetratricopeptide repeat protein, partial [Nannocystaceae bacterium]|nr:tetratricopeptide repeat protein [Nannocystaceae bacterium]